MKGRKKTHIVSKVSLSLLMALGAAQAVIPTSVSALEVRNNLVSLGQIVSVTTEANFVYITFSNGEKAKITFLENNIFRLAVNNDGSDTFKEYATPNSEEHVATIVEQSDTDTNAYTLPTASAVLEEGSWKIHAGEGSANLRIDAATSMMALYNADGTAVWEEAAPLQFKKGQAIQTLKKNANENFFGGGTQNGRFVHTNKRIEIANTNNWVDGGVASPNPFFWSTNGYGVLRNTFKKGYYDFGSKNTDIVETSHDENGFDAYYFVDKEPTAILDDYWQVTGNPALFPYSSFYLGHLNCYNRDEWKEVASGGILLEDGKRYSEKNNGGAILNGGTLETLNGTSDDDYKFSARAVIDGHEDNDMPLGWFLPNDGYGCGYGQDRESLDNNVANLREFTDYAESKGLKTGLWTQSALTPDAAQPAHLQRDFVKEVLNGGVRVLKTDVAWVGPGYSFALNGVKFAYDIIAETTERPTIVTLDGWAGTQRYGAIWSGDQTGGNWEYIRFHIPTYIGQSLSGNPNVTSDLDGIFGGSSLISTRDFQWKTFTTVGLDMDGWGSYPKKPYIFGDPTTSINRTYLKLKTQIMPYVYSTAYTSSGLGVGSEKGKPQVRAMFLEYPEDANAYSTNVQYQFMFGSDFLVAPVYQNTQMDSEGNDIRNGIYLPDRDQIWIDYFTGEQYRGGTTLNNFDAPLWKLPLFVKNGAIIPMLEAHNNAQAITETNPNGIDRTKRIVEFYPAGDTSYIEYEDDGVSIDATDITEPTYGSVVTTNYTSTVEGKKATLRANAAEGSFDGFVAERETTFVVNVSKKPTSLVGTVGDSEVSLTEVTSEEEFENAEGNVYFYNTAPNLNKFATEGSEFANVEITTTPKLYVKFANTNISTNAVELVVNGFENDGNLVPDTLTDLETPEGLTSTEETITPTSILLSWDEVANATGYEVETDGIIQSGITATEFNHVDLPYHSTHTYRVRAVNEDGHSEWSSEYKATSALDPYRNVPKDIKLSWGQGDSWGKLANALDFDYGTMFHSTNGDAVGKDFIMDLGKVYKLDRFEYTPRQDNKGNGTVQQLDVYTSVDGKTYTKVHDGTKNEWTYSSDMEVRDTKTITLDGESARYLKLVVRKSKGGFFSAAEMQPYFVDGTTGIVIGDTNNDDVVDEKDLVQIDNYVGLETGDATWDQVARSDYNNNGYYDAFDIAMTARLLDGGIAKVGKDVAGSITLSTNKKAVKAGETIDININGLSMKNVYALGVQLAYDADAFEFVSAKSSVATNTMKQFTFDRNLVAPKDGKNRATNLVFTNVGDQDLIDGTQSLGKITLKARKDTTWDASATLAFANLVGNNISEVNALAKGEEPVLPETTRAIELDEIESISFSNDVKENMDGSELWQGNDWKNVLFDGNRSGALAEFKWWYGTDNIAAEVKLPTDMIFTFDALKAIKEVNVYNRASSNGRATSMKAVAYSGDTQIELGTISTAQDVFTFPIPSGTMVDKVVITPLTSIGNATGTTTGTEANRMLSLHEIEFIEGSEVEVTGITLAEDTPDTLYINKVVDVKAQINPTNASNPLYKVTTLDSHLVEIFETQSKDGYAYAINAIAPGVATIRVASRANPSIYKDHTFTISADADTSQLTEKIAEIDDMLTRYGEMHLSKESFDALTVLKATAEDAIANKVSQDAIDEIIFNIHVGLSKVTFNKADGEELVAKEGMRVVSATNEADSDYKEHVIDGKTGTIWHSSYQSAAKLPVDVVVDLGGVYSLKEVDYLARQNGHNGHVTKARVEVSTDGVSFTEAATATFKHKGGWLVDYDQYQPIKFQPVDARYVKFVALETLGDTNNKYASVAELNFYAENVEATSIRFEQEEMGIVVGGFAEANIIADPITAHPEITYTSNRPKVVSVDDNGVIRALKMDGRPVTITATTKVGDKTLTATTKVTTIFTDKDSLDFYLDLANEYLADDTIHAVVLKVLQVAVDEGAIVYNDVNATPEAVEAAIMKLQSAVELAHFKAPIVAELEAAIIDLKEINVNEYDPEGRAEFKKALSDAETLLEKVDVELILQGDIDEALATLQETSDALVYLNPARLHTSITRATTIFNSLEEYADGERKDAFVEAYNAANTLLEELNAQIADPTKDGTVTYDQISKAVSNVNSTMSQLQRRPSAALVDQINALLAKVDALNVADYEAADISVVRSAALALRTMVQSGTTTATQAQAEYDKVLGLVNGLKPIVKPEVTPPSTGNTPNITRPTRPALPQVNRPNLTPNTPTKPNVTPPVNDKDVIETPKTEVVNPEPTPLTKANVGLETPWYVAGIGLLAILSLGFVFVIRRKKESK